MRKDLVVKAKKAGALIATLALVVTSGISTVKASNDNIQFNFNLKAHYANTYSPSRYRQTTNTNNKWKVNLAYSSEGANSIATFWLAKADTNHTRVSGTYDVHQGSGNHYYNAWAGASQTSVCLGAENNNDSANEYKISGYWDEETN
jgi:hypothetical protein